MRILITLLLSFISLYNLAVSPTLIPVKFEHLSGDAPSYENLASDSLALVDFKDANSQYFSLNWLSSNPLSTWEGVTLLGDRVVEIAIQSNNLRGQLYMPQSFMNMTELRVLDFSRNLITTIVNQFGGGFYNFSSLNIVELDLSANFLGDQEYFLSSNNTLEEVNLSNNTAFNTLNSGIGLPFLNTLKVLELSGNELPSDHPILNEEINAGVELDISDNNLDILDLSSPLIRNCNILKASDNQITQILNTEDIVLHCSDIWLFDNQITDISILIENLDMSYINRLRLNGNAIESIPPLMWQSTSLTTIQLEGNAINQTLDLSDIDLPQLRFLYLKDNFIHGELPQELGELSVNYIDFRNNNLSGCIPSSYSYFCSDYVALLDNNPNLIHAPFNIDATGPFCTQGLGACAPPHKIELVKIGNNRASEDNSQSVSLGTEFEVRRTADSPMEEEVLIKMVVSGSGVYPANSFDLGLYDKNQPSNQLATIGDTVDIILAANQRAKSFIVQAKDDVIQEDVEGFELRLIETSIGSIASNVTIGAIIDNENCNFGRTEIQGDESNKSFEGREINIKDNSILSRVNVKAGHEIDVSNNVDLLANTSLIIEPCKGATNNTFIDPSMIHSEDYELVSDVELTIGTEHELLLTADPEVINKLDVGKVILDPYGSGHFILITEVLSSTNIAHKKKKKLKRDFTTKGLKGLLVPLNVFINGGEFTITGNQNNAKENADIKLNLEKDSESKFQGDLAVSVSPHPKLEVEFTPLDLKTTATLKLGKTLKIEDPTKSISAEFTELKLEVDPSIDVKAIFTEMTILQGAEYMRKLTAPLASPILSLAGNELPGNLQFLGFQSYTDFLVGAKINIKATGQFDGESPKLTLYEASGGYLVGVVPFLQGLKVTAHIEGNVQGAVDIDYELKKEVFLYSGINFDEDSGISYNASSKDGNVTQDFTVTIDVGVDVRLVITAELQVSVGGLIGPKLSPELHLGAEANGAFSTGTRPSDNNFNLSYGAYLSGAMKGSLNLSAFHIDRLSTTLFELDETKYDAFLKYYFYRAPHDIEIIAGDGQMGLPNDLLERPLEVKVTDTRGEPLQSIPVRFLPIDDTNALPQFVLTNSMGLAQYNWAPNSFDENGVAHLEASISYASANVRVDEENDLSFSIEREKIEFVSNLTEIIPSNPVDGAEVTNILEHLSWTVPSISQSLDWEVYLDGGLILSSIIFDPNSQPSLFSIELDQTLETGTHSWYVVAKSASGDIITTSDIWTFKYYDLLTNFKFELDQEITGEDLKGTDAVAISGNNIVVNSPGTGVELYENIEGEWTLKKKLSASGNRYFGNTLAISDDFVAIGEPYVNGKVHIYRETADDWIFVQTLSELPSYFGRSIDMSSQFLVIGTDENVNNNNTNSRGSAYVYRLSGNSFVLDSKLTAVDRAYSYFGESVSVSGNILVFGDSNKGKVYVFKNVNSSWLLSDEIYAPEGYSNFGVDVDIDSNRIIISASDYNNGLGGAFIYEYINGSWIQDYLLSSETEDVHVYGNYAFFASGSSISVYQKLEESWVESQLITEPYDVGIVLDGKQKVDSDGEYLVAASPDVYRGGGSFFIYKKIPK